MVLFARQPFPECSLRIPLFVFVGIQEHNREFSAPVRESNLGLRKGKLPGRFWIAPGEGGHDRQMSKT